MRPAIIAALCTALVSVALAGCVPSGDDPRSRLTEARPESGAYVVRYLEPPWQLVSIVGDTVTLHVVIAGALSGLDGSPGSYDFVSTVERGAPAAMIDREASMARSRGDEVLAGPRMFTTADGVTGTEMVYQDRAVRRRYHRILALPLRDHVLRVELDATPDLDSPEVDAMLAQISIGATP